MAATVPVELPPDLADFTGREEELRRARGALLRRDRSAAGVPVLSGPGGAGKTALAVHVGHRLAHAYPGGRVLVDLRGSTTRPLDPADARAEILRGLGVEAGAVPADPHESTSLYRELITRRRALVLLDDAADSAQVRPLLPGAVDGAGGLGATGQGGCAVVVTSRRQLLALPGAVLVPLDGLDTDDALALFGRILGGRRAHPESPYAADVVDACGHLPLAIRIAAARLSSRPRWSVESLAGRLRRQRRRLAGAGREDIAVEASVALSYAWLDATHARALRMLALPESPVVCEGAAATLLDLPAGESGPILGALAGLGLVQPLAAGHYRCHDLVRRYATERAAATDPPADRAAAMARLLDHYATRAAEAGPPADAGPGEPALTTALGCA